MKEHKCFKIANGDYNDAVNLIYEKAINLHDQLDNDSRIVFLDRRQKNVDWLERLFGYEFVKKLRKGTLLNSGISAKFETLNTYQKRAVANDILIIYRLSSEEIKKLEVKSDIKAIFALFDDGNIMISGCEILMQQTLIPLFKLNLPSNLL